MTPDIEEIIKKNFGKDCLLAIDLLSAFETEDKLGPRVSRCIVHLAGGDIVKLEASIQNARDDWRDVIYSAEAVPSEFNKPFR
jgi:hypothetical protein